MNEKEFFSCIIPAYNEEKTIDLVIKAVLNHSLIKEVIVVSDGSSDRTKEIAIKNGAHKVIQLRKNIGKGGAVLKGMNKSSYDNLLLLDADLTNLKSHHIDALIKPLLEDKNVMMSIGILHNQLLTTLSGQRAVRKSLVLGIDKKLLLKSRYGFEIILDNFAKKSNSKVVFVNLRDIHFIRTFYKFSFLRSLLLEFKFVKDLLRIFMLLIFFRLK